MDVIAEALHVRKTTVRMEDTLCVALALPCVIDVDIDVAGIAHAGVHEHVGSGADVRVSHMRSKMVPAVPAHGRCRGDLRLAESRRGGEKNGIRNSDESTHRRDSPGKPITKRH